MKRYYHLFANGDDAKNFITSDAEFKLAFNRIGLCAYLSGAIVVAFSIEDSHPHVLLYGEYEECRKFHFHFKTISSHTIVSGRGNLDGVRLNFELYEVKDEMYLRNVAIYVIIQATKDGKSVMPYDYLFGSGALYFRSRNVAMPWLLNDNGRVEDPIRFDALNYREKRKLCGSKSDIPGDWLVCNGFILPMNYVDVKRFESIFRTHNCFRVFLSSGKDKYVDVLDKMASARGVLIEDLEARKLCESICIQLFGRKGTRHISIEQRVTLAREMYRRHGLSMRQISTLTKLPEEEVRKYLQ